MKAKTKYDIGEYVYYWDKIDQVFRLGMIDSVDIFTKFCEIEVRYGLSGMSSDEEFLEENLYPTKEDALKSIKFWTK